MRGGAQAAEKMDETAATAKDFAIIKLAGRQGNQDQDPVPVFCNEDRNWIKRGVWVPVTRGQVEVLRNSTYPVYSNEPGEDKRKTESMVERFPFSIAKWVTADGYRRLKALASKRELTQAEIDAAE